MKYEKHQIPPLIKYFYSLILFNNCVKSSDEPVPNDPAADVAVGDNYQGGIIFYIFEEEDNGYVAGEVHGLIRLRIKSQMLRLNGT